MSNILGPKQGYVDILLESLEAKHKKDHETGKSFQRTPIRPSAAGNCERELYYQLREYAGMEKFPYSPRSGEDVLLLDLGHAIERHLVNKFRNDFSIAEVKYTQQTLDFGRIEAVNNKNLSQHVEGSLDLCLWSDKHRVCIDVKSKGDRHDFRARKTAWAATSDKLGNMKSVEQRTSRLFWVDNLDAFLDELGDPFFEANFRQLNMYLNSDFLKSRNVDHGAIIQYQKNKSLLREVRFRPSATIFQQTMDKFKNVIRAVDTDTVDNLAAPYSADSFKSRYCNSCKANLPNSCRVRNGGK